jgi:hypothetical protein
MSEISVVSIKQQLIQLSEQERRELSAFLIRLGQDTPEWRQEMSRRLSEMEKGEKVSSAELRKRLIGE